MFPSRNAATHPPSLWAVAFPGVIVLLLGVDGNLDHRSHKGPKPSPIILQSMIRRRRAPSGTRNDLILTVKTAMSGGISGATLTVALRDIRHCGAQQAGVRVSILGAIKTIHQYEKWRRESPKHSPTAWSIILQSAFWLNLGVILTHAM